MPVTPTVFRPIRSNDFQQRNFKAYKNYRITSDNFITSSGYVHHNAIYKSTPIHVGVNDLGYAENNLLDNTNRHVIWHSLNHRYYEYPYDPARSAELTNISETNKHLYESASSLSLPYFEVGERIKPGSVTGTFTHGSSYILQDDTFGNLRDVAISTSSFASASRNILYMTFNKEFESSSPVQTQYNTDNFVTSTGPIMLGTSGLPTSGQSFQNLGTSRIRIPHESKFNRFNNTDDWTISFWHNSGFGLSYPIISKVGVGTETYFDSIDKIVKTRDNVRFIPNITGSYTNTRTPFVIGHSRIGSGASNISGSWHFQASNGSTALHISSSGHDHQFLSSLTKHAWKHVCIRNSNSVCQIFVNGKPSGTSGSLPTGTTANNDDIIIGSYISGSQVYAGADNKLAELRMFDYAASDIEIASLSNRHYISGSLFQTNTAGNVFYRNGEIVISSPMSKYNTGSGAFGNTFDVTYKGTHTIYENEVLIRVPKDQFNVSMNPSATFIPATNKILSQAEEANTLPGELIKTMFVKGIAKPYITTIGLYNDNAELLAVSKLAQPIQKRNDIDTNFIVRWDY